MRTRPLLTRLLLACVVFFSSAVGNHTGRIKVVFTPTICKLTCVGGRCHNHCKQGNTTTIISENGRATDTLTAPNFRVGECCLLNYSGSGGAACPNRPLVPLRSHSVTDPAARGGHLSGCCCYVGKQQQISLNAVKPTFRCF